MSNYLIVSHKRWNSSLADDMKFVFQKDNWFFIDNKEDFNLENIQKIAPEYIFIPHWSYLINEKIYKSYNCIVFHMTDLPYGRGGSPLQNLISRGISETKISAIVVEKQLDAGPVYLKMNLSLFGSAEEIFIRANKVIVEMITKIINEKIKPEPQTGTPTMFKRKTQEMSEITNELKELDYLYDHIRMLDAEGYPKAFFETNFFKFEFTRATLKSDGTIISDVKITKK
jgi:methionyl-tRNA formyltransferase